MRTSRKKRPYLYSGDDYESNSKYKKAMKRLEDGQPIELWVNDFMTVLANSCVGSGKVKLKTAQISSVTLTCYYFHSLLGGNCCSSSTFLGIFQASQPRSLLSPIERVTKNPAMLGCRY